MSASLFFFLGKRLLSRLVLGDSGRLAAGIGLSQERKVPKETPGPMKD
jgi:hypothetical protein